MNIFTTAAKSSIAIASVIAVVPLAVAAPASLTQVSSYGPGRVGLDWPAVSGAAGYNIKRSDTPGGPYTLLGSTSASTTSYSDVTPVTGRKYYYAVTSVTSTGESAGFREAAASPAIIVDNKDSASVTTTGNWPSSTLSGYYGSDSVYAGTTNVTTPSATFQFTPDLPFYANYDVYMRWPAYPSRATATPVDIRYADGAMTTVTVNQTADSGVWKLLGTFACTSGKLCSVTIRNNTTSGGSVGADAVQFVPRLAPWAPRGIGMEDYTVSSFSDECEGTSLDPAKWTRALGRDNVSVGGGKISLDVTYVGPGTAATATLADLKSPYNWRKGAAQPVDDRKFGYYETRFRVVQNGGGVDCAFWMQSKGSLLPYEDFEFDSPEAFPNADLSSTALIYGMWDHVGGSPPWRMNKITYPKTWGSKYHTYGMEWRTDNVLVHYLDGVEIGRSTPGAVNSIACMAPVDTYLSCYVGNYWQPTADIDGQSMKVDYLRCYQKPGWIGAAGNATTSWGDARNWGPDGVPSAGEAAVFNMPVTQQLVTLLGDKPVQSISFDGASVSAMTISGGYRLQLGAGSDGVIQGGVSMSSSVTVNQTIGTDIIGLQNLSFINNSRSGASLVFNGVIDGDSATTPRQIHLAANQPILISKPLGSHIGEIDKWGAAVFAMPANSAYTGRTLVAQGVLGFDDAKNGGLPSGLGASSSSSANLLLYPRVKYNDAAQRPCLRYTGPLATTNRGITLGYFCDGILDASGSGPISYTGPFTIKAGNTGAAILELTGTNTDANTFAGTITDSAALNPSGAAVSLEVRKSGPGKWLLSASNSWKGDTRINGGTLVITGALNCSGSLAVAAAATLDNQGDISAADGITLDSGGTYRVSLAAGGSATLATTGGVSLHGKLDLTSAAGIPAGSSFTILVNGGTAPVTGTFAGMPEGYAFIKDGYHWTITYTGGDGNDVVLKAVPAGMLETWRFLHFGTIANTGTAADSNDADGDGESNLLEFATGQNPHAATRATVSCPFVKGSPLRFTYIRLKVPPAEAAFHVEWSDTLANDWSTAGVVSDPPVSIDAATESVTATIPAATGSRRFVRLNVTTP